MSDRKCDLTGCNNDAQGLYTWGLYPNGDRNKNVPLCSIHAQELWKAVEGIVTTDLCHFVISPLDCNKGD